MVKRILKYFNALATRQSEPMFGVRTSQVANSAGGYSWAVDDWVRLDRFLVLGADGGSCYASPRERALDNARVVQRCVAADGLRTVDRIVDISLSGRAPRNDPAIFALGVAMKMGDDITRQAARASVPAVCRIGTHLFSLADVIKSLGGRSPRPERPPVERSSWGRSCVGGGPFCWIRELPSP